MKSPFSTGVASGDPTTTGVVLWTRVDPSPAEAQTDVVWELESEDGTTLRTGSTVACTSADFTVCVPVDDLPPGTDFRYRFYTPDDTSPVGRTRTLTENPDRARIAIVSCAKFNAGYFNAYRHLADRDDLDFVLHLGDYIYEAAEKPAGRQTPGASIGRSFEPVHECRSLDDYRRRYQQYRQDPDLQALHAAHPFVCIIDDHELADNAWAGGAEEHDSKRDGPWQQRYRAAMQAWAEWIPSRCERPVTTVHRDFLIGDLARLVLIDGRSHRSAPSTPVAQRSQLGESQLQSLGRIAANPGTPWLIFANSSILTPVWMDGLPAPVKDALRTLKMIDLDSDGPFSDSWDHFPDERSIVVELLASSPAECVVLSGDVHIGVDAWAKTGSTRLREFVTPSVTSQNLDDKRGLSSGSAESLALVEQMCAVLEGVEWLDLDRHGFTIVDVTSDAVTAEWWAVPTVLHRTGEAELVRRVAHRHPGMPANSRKGAWPTG